MEVFIGIIRPLSTPNPVKVNVKPKEERKDKETQEKVKDILPKADQTLTEIAKDLTKKKLVKYN